MHVKNTGRCRELLTDQAVVYLDKSTNPDRSTAYDLVAVKKGKRMINMDSQAPNKAVEEWLQNGGLFEGISLLRPESKYRNSRFDFYVETPDEKVFIECHDRQQQPVQEPSPDSVLDNFSVFRKMPEIQCF